MDIDEKREVIIKKWNANMELEVEKNIMKYLKDIWNLFLELEQTHPSDIDDFANAIHDLQKIIGMRELRRLYPDRYVTIKKRRKNNMNDIDEKVDRICELKEKYGDRITIHTGFINEVELGLIIIDKETGKNYMLSM